MVRRIIAVSIAFLMTLTVLSACNSNKDPVKDMAQSTSQSIETREGETTEPAGDSGELISKEPITLDAHIFVSGYPLSSSTVVFDEVAKRTNVILKGSLPESATDYALMFNLMMVSGKISDIVTAYKTDFDKYGREGAFIPLNDLLEKYAPHIMTFFEERPDVKKYATSSDGNIYFIPFVPDGEAAMGYFIRKDWLDKLQLSIPDTADELYDALLAFKDRDPNGNGKKDEIPFFDRNWWDVFQVPASFQGVIPDFYVDSNGKVKHGLYSPDAKKAFAYAAKWYQKGISDREIFTRGDTRSEFLGSGNVGGFTHDWFASTSSKAQRSKEDNPGLDFIPIIPPAGVDGVRRELSSRVKIGDHGWGISSTDKYPIETIKYFDYFFTEEGRRLMNFGIEGEHYVMENGKPKFNEIVTNNPDGYSPLDVLRSIGAQWEIGFHQDYYYEEQLMDDVAREGARTYIENNFFMPQFPTLDYNEEESRVMVEKKTAVTSFIDESIQKFITGNMSVENDFDEYLKSLKNLGIEELIAANQTAYDRYNK